ncbi:MAG: DUF6049 family protein, partial [Solirubrobacteraceae bacterium]
LKASTAGQSAFLSPYANVDVAALSHSGLDSNLRSAYQLGERVAGRILPATFGIKGSGTGDGAVLKAAWPADGLADAGVLTSLASEGGINTVVLSDTEVPTDSLGDTALAKTVNSVGGTMALLLANSRITSLLGTASKARTAASEFALTQDFLAQTAMIASEQPSTSRSLVVAPPTDWAPSASAADKLLESTHNAPWLHPTGLSTLASQAASLPSATRVWAKKVSGAELSDDYLDEVSTVASRVSVFSDILFQPPAREVDLLDGAVATLESSAWRGGGSAGGFFAMGLLTGYLNHAQTKVEMIASKKLLLAGQSGQTPVSVQNGLDWPIRVQVMAAAPVGSQLQLDTSKGILTVPAHGTNQVRMSVHSSTLGTTT